MSGQWGEMVVVRPLVTVQMEVLLGISGVLVFGRLSIGLHHNWRRLGEGRELLRSHIRTSTPLPGHLNTRMRNDVHHETASYDCAPEKSMPLHNKTRVKPKGQFLV